MTSYFARRRHHQPKAATTGGAGHSHTKGESTYYTDARIVNDPRMHSKTRKEAKKRLKFHGVKAHTRVTTRFKHWFRHLKGHTHQSRF